MPIVEDASEDQPLVDPRRAIGYLCALTAQCQLDALRKRFTDSGLDLPQAQFIVLINLYRKDGQTQQELARRCTVDKSAIKRSIDNLEDRGLVERKLERRTSCRGGARCYRISLTEKAQQLRNLILKVSSSHLDEVRSLFSDGQYEMICDSLLRVLEHFGKRLPEDE